MNCEFCGALGQVYVDLPYNLVTKHGFYTRLCFDCEHRYYDYYHDIVTVERWYK